MIEFTRRHGQTIELFESGGADGRRTRLRAGRGAYFERGEMHATGGITSTTAIMVQVAEPTPGAAEDGSAA